MATKTKQDIYNSSPASRNGVTYEDWLKGPMKLPYTDDDYLAEIEQYKDKSWYSQLLNNPWLAGNQAVFSPNFGQQIASLFGDDSAEDKYYAELRSNRSQWLSEFLEKMRQQEYNEPIQQVQRDIAAGINPDLAGNIDSGAAAENDQPLLGHPSFGDSSSLSSIGSFFMNIYSLASGFAKDMMSFQSMENKLTSEDLSINKDIVSATTDFIKGHLGQPLYDKDSKSFSFPELSLDDLKDYAKKNFRSISGRKRFIKEVNSSYNSARSLYTKFGAITDLEHARSAMADSLGYNVSRGMDYSGAYDFDPIITVATNLNKLSLDIEKYQKTYTSNYFHNVSGKKAADAVNAQNDDIVKDVDARSYQRGIDKIVNSTMQKIINDLEKGSTDPGLSGLISKGMLMFLSAYRLQMFPSMPNINLSGLIQNKNFNTANNTFL